MNCKALNRWGLIAAMVAGNLYAQSSPKPGNWSSLKFEYTNAIADTQWDQALPIGNGRIGAMVFGSIASERLQLNEVTFWSGGPRVWDNPSALQYLPQARKALFAGQYHLSDTLCMKMQGPYTESYQPLGNIYLDFSNTGAITNYYRCLDLDGALVTVRYKQGAVTFTREVFASNPDQVIVIRLSADAPKSLTFAARMDSRQHYRLSTENNNRLIMWGKGPKHVDPASHSGPNPIVYDSSDTGPGMTFEAHLSVSATGGTVAAQTGAIAVTGADTVLLVYSSATSYNGPDKEPGTQGVDPSPLVRSYLSNAVGKAYGQLLAAHQQDFRQIFRRFWIELSDTATALSTIQYNRYQLIAASRPGGQPVNQQVMWNDVIQPPWESGYTMNENVENHYNMAETGNLMETAQPLFSFISDLARHGANTALVNYGCRGWCSHHVTDLWRQSAPFGNGTGYPRWANWPVGGLWLCQHLWEHYAFGGDKTFLADTAYPIMKGAAQFAMDWLIPDSLGRLVTAPSTSPENMYMAPDGKAAQTSIASTMDMTLIRQIFTTCCAAARELNTDAAFAHAMDSVKARLYPFTIGSKGQLLEWFKEFPDQDPQHRHASHLVGLWPLDQITPRGTPSLWAAAKQSLILRGNGGYLPDKSGMWARLLQGDSAMKSYPYPAACLELILQSHTGDLEVLPALPTSWTNGKVLGIRARGGYELDIEWANRQLTHCTIRGPAGKAPVVRLGGQVINIASDSRFTTTTAAAGGVGKKSETVFPRITSHRNFWTIGVSSVGSYSISIIDVLGIVRKTIEGKGPAVLKISSRDIGPGIYLLRYKAVGGAHPVSLVRMLPMLGG